jgi:DNA invertase Pin-like site-specific DNA recombinase
VPGDTVVVTKLDRLERSSRDLHILHDLKEGSCGFVSPGERWCDTTSNIGQLVVTIMSGIAKFERKLILSRTEAGIAKARENGKKFGRPSAIDFGQKRKIAVRYAAGRPWRPWPSSTMSTRRPFSGRCKALSIRPRDAAHTRR